MDLDKLIQTASPEITIFTITTCIAFLSWLIKGLIEKPLSESKATFTKYAEKRLHVLSEVKVRLRLIAYFPEDDGEGKNFKEQIQEFLMKDGNAAYLNKRTFESVLKISITPKTEEKLLLETITEIDEDLYSQISKIQDEINFYRKFSNYNPLKRLVGFGILALLYAMLFALTGLIIATSVILIIDQNWLIRLITVLSFGIFIMLIGRWVLR